MLLALQKSGFLLVLSFFTLSEQQPYPYLTVRSRWTLVALPSPHLLHRKLFLPRDVDNMLLPLGRLPLHLDGAHHPLLREAFIFLSLDHHRQDVHCQVSSLCRLTPC